MLGIPEFNRAFPPFESDAQPTSNIDHLLPLLKIPRALDSQAAEASMNAPFDWTLARYNDSAGAADLIDRLGSELAAIIVEPMMSNGGCIAG